MSRDIREASLDSCQSWAAWFRIMVTERRKRAIQDRNRQLEKEMLEAMYAQRPPPPTWAMRMGRLFP